MRRMMQAAICVVLVWLCMAELGGWSVYEGEAARESEQWRVSAAASTSYYEPKPLLAEPASYDPEIEIEQNKLLVAAAAIPNNRVEKSSVPVPAPSAKPAASAEKVNKVVYLTFDDGPSKHTEQVLDILKQEGIKASFFVLGEQVLKQPDIAKRIIEEGHAIGNHSYDHKYEKLYGDFVQFSEQIMKTDEAIFKTTGVRTTFVRAPGGTYNNFDKGYFDAMAAAGYSVYDWNVDSGDSKRRNVPSSEIIAKVKGSKLADKLIVLLHDSNGHEQSVKALPEIIKYYKNKGYSFAPITDQVEPIQFTVAEKLKWSRPRVSETQAAKLVQYSESIGRRYLETQTQRIETTLILQQGKEKLELKSGEYGLKNGSIEVSLLRLMEWIGGSADLDMENGVFEANHFGERLFWKSDAAAENKWSSGHAEQVTVPVRSTLKKFGIRISNFVYNDEQREIWLTE